MSDKISSLSNPKVKQVVRLRQRRARDEAGLTIIEGAKELATLSIPKVPVAVTPRISSK